MDIMPVSLRFFENNQLKFLQLRCIEFDRGIVFGHVSWLCGCVGSQINPVMFELTVQLNTSLECKYIVQILIAFRWFP